MPDDHRNRLRQSIEAKQYPYLLNDQFNHLGTLLSVIFRTPISHRFPTNFRKISNKFPTIFQTISSSCLLCALSSPMTVANDSGLKALGQADGEM